MRHAAALLFTLFALFTLAGCGKQGELLPPEGYVPPEERQAPSDGS